MIGRKIYILITAVVLGVFIMAQNRSFQSVSNILVRDNQGNVFQEIRILKAKNLDLRQEMEELEIELTQLDDQNLSLDVVDQEIEKYDKLSGDSPIFGPGLEISINGDVTMPWFIDLHNEFLMSGAEAISINDIRITNETAGFDTLPKGEILVHGQILAPAYVFKAIGDAEVMASALEVPGGFLSRLKNTFSDVEVVVEAKDVVYMQ